MTPAAAASLSARHESTLRRVELRLRLAALRLGPGASVVDVKAAYETMTDAERTLGELGHDPWEPSIAAQARSILSSHILAAEACEVADAGIGVTARVLRRGANSAHALLLRRVV